MKNSILTIITAVALFISGCEKEMISAPEIQTISVKVPSTTGATFAGNVSSLGMDRIIDHGFLYGYTANLDETTGIKISLGEVVNLGEFSTTIDALTKNNAGNFDNRLFVKSYITDQRGTVYGSTINAVLPIPTMGIITPAQASVGDTVRISGKFFSPNILSTEVLIGQKAALVLSASDTLITAVVPAGVGGAHGTHVPVMINLGGTSAPYYQGLALMAKYTGFTPQSGPVGTAVTLLGENLPDYYTNNLLLTLQMGQENIPLTWNNYNRFTVPFNIAEKSSIAVTLNGKVYNLPGEFTVTAPEIVSFSTSTVFAGRQVTMRLNTSSIANPSTNVGRPQVKVGAGSYTDVSWNNQDVTFMVPANTPKGDHTVYFKVGPHEIQSPTKLKVVGYEVSGFKPAIGAVGTSVEITGTFIAGEYYNVYFGSRSVSGFAKSSSIVTAAVPSGVDLGKLKISVQTSSGRISVPGEMEIIGSSMTSVSTLTGVPGTKVTITGSGFSSTNSWNTYVSFGWNYVTPEIIDGNTIVVFVPSNIGRGSMALSIIVEGQTITYKENFTIL